MDDRLQRRRDETERKRVFGMCMDHRRYVWACLKNRCVNEALQIGMALIVDRLALPIELDQVVAFDQFGGERARHKETLRIVGMANADVAVGINHVFLCKDTVGDDEVTKKIVELAHSYLPSEETR